MFRLSTKITSLLLITLLTAPYPLLAGVDPFNPDDTQNPGVWNPEQEQSNMAATDRANFLNQGPVIPQSITFGIPSRARGMIPLNVTIDENWILTIEGKGKSAVLLDAFHVFGYNEEGQTIFVDIVGDSTHYGKWTELNWEDVTFTDDGFIATVQLTQRFLYEDSQILDIDKLTIAGYGGSDTRTVNPSSSPLQTPISNNPLSEPISDIGSFTNSPDFENSNPLLISHSPLPSSSNTAPFIQAAENQNELDTKQWLSEKGLETWNVPSSHSVNNPFKPMILKVAEGFMNYSRLDPLNIKALFNQVMERTEFKSFSPLIEMVSKIMDLIPNQLRGILKTLFQFFEGLQERIYERHLLALRPYYESLWNEVLKPLQSILEKFGILLPEKPELQAKVSKEEVTWMQAMDQVMKKIIYLYQKNSLPQGIRSKLTFALSREAELHERFITPIKGSFEEELKNSLINFILKLKEKILIRPNTVHIQKQNNTTEGLVRVV